MRMQQGSGHAGCAIDLTNGTSSYRYPEYPSAAITHFAKIDETSSTHGAMNSMIDTDSTLTASCQTIDSPDFDSDAH